MSAEQKDQNGVDGVFKTAPADEESEPCLEEKNKGRVLWERTEQKLRDKSGLSRRGLYYVGGLLLVAFLLLIVVIVLAACWPITPHHWRYPVCTTESCLRATEQVREYLHESAPRCNARDWACGRWLQGRQLPPERSKWNRRMQVEQQEAVHIREMISTLPLPLSFGTIEWKLKYFYEACVDMDSVIADGDRPLHTIISELGGWHMLRNWNTGDFDFNGLLRTLHVTYGVSPYFKITTMPNPREPGNTSIVILPSGLGLPDKSYYYLADDKYSKAYEQLITDVIVLLGQSTTDTQRSAKDVYSYERRLAEIMPNREELQDPIGTYNPMQVSALKLSVLQILPLQDILMAMYPDANINEETEVVVAQPDYLTKLSQLVSSTDSQTRNSYMMWTLVREYVPLLSADFQKAMDRYHSEIYGVKKPIERWEFCTNLVQKFMPIAIEAVLERQDPMDEAKHVVNQIFEEIVANLRVYLDLQLSNNKYSSDLHSKLKKKLELVKLHIGLPDIAHNATYVKTFYNKLNIIKSNLFESHKKAIIFSKKREEQLLRESSIEDYLMAATTRRPAHVEYVPTGNVVVVPRVLLTSPYFEAGYSRSINYARIGNDIALALVSSILPYESAWAADSKLLSQYHVAVNESLKIAAEPRNCLREFIERNHLAQGDFAKLTALNTFKYLTALEAAHTSMLASLENKAHIHMPTLEIYEDSDLFYLTNLQELCTLSTDQQNLYDTLVSHKLPENGLFDTVLHQSRGLAASLLADCTVMDTPQCIK